MIQLNRKQLTSQTTNHAEITKILKVVSATFASLFCMSKREHL